MIRANISRCLRASGWLLQAFPTPVIAAHSVPGTQEVLQRMLDNTAAFRRTLPSLSAEEAITASMGIGPFRHSVHATASLRVLRVPGSEALQESRTFLTFQGQPVAQDGSPVPLPMTLQGGFGEFQSTYFSPAVLPCYTYQLSQGPHRTLRMDFTARPDAVASRPGCQRANSIEGFALLDPGSLQILHLQRTVTQPELAPPEMAAFAAVDLAPARIGDETFWLPVHVEGTSRDHAHRFEAHYTHYQRYSGTISILPGTNLTAP